MGKVIQLCALSEPFVAIHQAVAGEGGAFDTDPNVEAVAALALIENNAAEDDNTDRWLAPVLAGGRVDTAPTQAQGGSIWRVVSRRDFDVDPAGWFAACIADGKARSEKHRQAMHRKKAVVLPALLSHLKLGEFFAGVGLKNGTYVDGALKGLGAAEVEEGLEFLKKAKKIRMTAKGWVRVDEPAE